MTVSLPSDVAAARIAATIGDPTRARMLYCLMDGRARTSTELALVAQVSPSTASLHLKRLKAEHLAAVEIQGKHRYYRLQGAEVASALEAITVLAGDARRPWVSTATQQLREARTCYDHLAGALGVCLHDRLITLGWWAIDPERQGRPYDLTDRGITACEALGLDVMEIRKARRRLGFSCLDWSERRPHLGGALGAALLRLALENRWVIQARGDRSVSVTALGRRTLWKHFGLEVRC